MKVGWLIDADLLDKHREELVAAILHHGHEVKLIHAPSPPFRWDDVDCSYRETFPRDACVVSCGDIELVTRIHKERRWTPGAFGTVENFFWSTYACHYGKYLLNQDYVMLPFGELDRLAAFLFEMFGRDGRIFVRPDSPLKLFTGQIATQETFAADLEFMGFYDFPRSSLVVVSSPKNLLAEWRFVVVNRRVITGSQYRVGNTFDPRPEFDVRAFNLAQEIAAMNYQPDPVWVIDICQDASDSFRLLEIGGFSFADLYACDKSQIVREVSAAAIDLWKKVQAK